MPTHTELIYFYKHLKSTNKSTFKKAIILKTMKLNVHENKWHHSYWNDKCPYKRKTKTTAESKTQMFGSRYTASVIVYPSQKLFKGETHYWHNLTHFCNTKVWTNVSKLSIICIYRLSDLSECCFISYPLAYLPSGWGGGGSVLQSAKIFTYHQIITIGYR